MFAGSVEAIGLAMLLAAGAAVDFDARYTRLKADGVVKIRSSAGAEPTSRPAPVPSEAPGTVPLKAMPERVRALLASAPGLRQCPIKGASHRVIVDLALLPRGRLEAVAVATRPQDPGLVRCIRTVLRSIRFPGYASAPGEPRSVEVVNVSVALEFVPAPSPAR